MLNTLVTEYLTLCTAEEGTRSGQRKKSSDRKALTNCEVQREGQLELIKLATKRHLRSVEGRAEEQLRTAKESWRARSTKCLPRPYRYHLTRPLLSMPFSASGNKLRVCTLMQEPPVAAYLDVQML